MNVSVLATSLTAILSPAFPYLLSAGETAMEGVGSALGEDIWNRVKKIWAKLRPRMAAKPAAEEAIQDLAKTPDDEDTLAAFRYQLTKLLREDANLAAELARLLPEPASNAELTAIRQQAGDRSVQIGTISQAGDINLQR